MYCLYLGLQAQEALSECFLEDILDDLVIGPATENDIKDVAMDTLDKYSDKKRRKEIKEVNKSFVFLFLSKHLFYIL